MDPWYHGPMISWVIDIIHSLDMMSQSHTLAAAKVWYHMCIVMHMISYATSANWGTIISYYIISLYYTHYITYFFQISRLWFFIVSLSPKGLLFHLWHFFFFTYFTRISYSYYCNYHTIICIIFTSNYYYYYPFRRRFLHFFLYVYIIAIIAVLTLLFALFYIKLLLLLSFSKPIILIISFR